MLHHLDSEHIHNRVIDTAYSLLQSFAATGGWESTKPKDSLGFCAEYWRGYIIGSVESYKEATNT